MEDDNIFDTADLCSDYSISSTAQAVVNGDLENESIWSSFSRSNQKLMKEKSQDMTMDTSLNLSNSPVEQGCISKKNISFSAFVPSNMSTQISQNPVENNVILVQPSSTNDEITKKFLNNDINIANGLKNSGFKDAGIESVNKNRSRNLLIVKIKNTDNETISSLLAITKLGNYDVNCRLPNNKTKSIGVIGPIGIDTPINDLQEEILSQNCNVEKIERIFKGKDRTPTMSVKVVFTESELPMYLYVAFQRFKVSRFVGNPWQCYRCQGFGHNAAHCRYKPRCLVCAGPHSLRDCTKKMAESRIENVKCSNCKGDHTANYGGCPFYKDAKEVEKLRVSNKVSYRDAVKLQKDGKAKKIQSSQRQIGAPAERISNSENSQSSHSQIQATQSQKLSTKKSIATQTDSTANSVDRIEIIKGLAIIISNLFENKVPHNPITKDNVIQIFNKTFMTNIVKSDLNQANEVQISANEVQISANEGHTSANEVQTLTVIPETQDSQDDSETDWSLVISPKTKKRKNRSQTPSPKGKGKKNVDFLLTQLGVATRSNKFKKNK